MSRYIANYAEWVVRWRWAVLIGSILIALGVGSFAARQRFYNPYEMWFLPDDPNLVVYRQLTRQYGEDDVVIVAFRDPSGVFTNKGLGALLELTERLERTQFVDKVDSVASYQYVSARVNEDGEEELSVDDLVKPEELPLAAEELKQRERIALAEPPILGSLLGARDADGRAATTAAVVARVIINDDQPENAVRVVDSIRAVARQVEAKHGYRMYVTGVPVVEHAFMSYGRSEAATFVPLLLLTEAVLLYVFFRSVRAVVLPLAVIGLAIGPTLGIMALLGVWLNPLTVIVPQILITVGTADMVHVFTGFFELQRRGVARDGAVVGTLRQNFIPCFATSFTDVVAFGALLTASVVPMQELGIGASVGVVFAWFFSFTFLPAALAVWPGRGGSHAPDTGQMAGWAALWVARVLDRAATAVTSRPRTVGIILILVFAAVSVFVARIRVETAYKNMFKPDTSIRQDLDFIEGNLGGSEDVEISIDSGRSDGAKAPRFLEKVEAIQAFAAAQPQVSHTFSIVDVLKRMNTVMHDNDPGFNRLPNSTELSAQYLLLYTLSSRRADLKDRIDVDNRRTRVSVRVRAQSSTETQAMGERIRSFIRERYPELSATVTGKALLYTAMQERLKESTVNSFGTAFVFITVVMVIVFRSLKIGLLGMIPNLLPVIASGGVMGLVGIPLDPGSAIVASIGIGIAVDDTIHLISAYLTHRRAGVPLGEVVRRTFRDVGAAIVFTSVILSAGFLLFAFSEFNFIAYFGVLATSLIVLALIADLLLTPAILVLADRRRPRVSAPKTAPARVLPTLIIVLALSAVLGVPAATAGPAEERGRAIMDEQDRINSGYGDEVGLYRMVLVNANGDRSERTLEFRTLEGVKEGDRTVIVFKDPPDIRGTGLLTHQHRTGDDDQWLYLPALRRIKRIASSNRASSFVGSEFTYEDLMPPELSKYQYRYLRDDPIDGVPVWVVESVPRFKDSGYSRMELFLRRDNYQTVQANFYDKKGDLLKVARFEGWWKVDGRWWRARIVHMDNVQTRKSTRIEVVRLKIGNGLAPRDFTKRALERE